MKSGATVAIAAENSDVLKKFTALGCEPGSAVVFVAVAVTTFWLGTATLSVAENDPTPEPFVVTFVAPIKVCPSAAPPCGSGLLEKNSTLKVIKGETLCVRLPTICTLLPVFIAEVNTGKF